ncbi:MAG: 2-C-methyl-D-erythritol 4-phosphate cytidylyltransferase [Ignavibacteria bacterium RIFOXYB2_FULL_35_12]|nr:MAG: 2-C-methyl-D-erythritol 4-phosphate cytidylyltransferase [Ignavibacteria bacterium GWA2_36_19]OGU58949.1 MAG: 2-C-methyl-D-erythritol 4-phosphate cytidylyltransferase [Ignavibacteria bacterium GWF2_35_20]OGU80786.1 MAG: 2-C-methyl-D-erythritol 4-phosphate cytidylyltransferase [Ignavibacteria bacterium RIFOXYA2_FULL_35_9]OGU86108.1 MAG: 2-C-methyl-D-erythritol 4-phosphate cytidylyltransferase [Ignavibacteria bacterium RIFOXYA12_FULL_35_25]OGU92793.1 MAG: 2-C-methyl-D-erythritol 4-phospha
MKTFAIIPAAGKSKRTGLSIPKQYLRFNNKELIAYTLEAFQKNKSVDEIIIAAHPDYFSLLEKIKKKYKLTKINKIIKGGKERQDSVYNALLSIDANKNDLVAVHDAARPLLPQKVLTNAIITARKNGNALVCIRARDTLIRGTDIVESYLDRDEVYYVQTPQVFRYHDLMRAMELAYAADFYGTDESMLIKNLGLKINIVRGALCNFKVTTMEDIEFLQHYFKK